MTPDLDLNNPAHLQQAKDYVVQNANRFPLVGFDITAALLVHAEQAAAFRLMVAAELAKVEAAICKAPDQHYNEVYEAFRTAATRLGLDLTPTP